MQRLRFTFLVLASLLLFGCKSDLTEADVRKLVIEQWPGESEQKIEEVFRHAGFKVSFIAKESQFYALLPVRSHIPFAQRAILVRARVDSGWHIEELMITTEHDSV
jgi:hypothetical protein